MGVSHCDLPCSVTENRSDENLAVKFRIQFKEGFFRNRRVWGGDNLNHFCIETVQMGHGKKFSSANKFYYLVPCQNLAV